MNYNITTAKGSFLTSIGRDEQVTSVFIEAQRVADLVGETVNVTFAGRILYVAMAIQIDPYSLVDNLNRILQ